LAIQLVLTAIYDPQPDQDVLGLLVQQRTDGLEVLPVSIEGLRLGVRRCAMEVIPAVRN